MSRRYLVRPLPPPGPHLLPVDVAHHLAVVRVRVDEELVLFDGGGLEATARVVDVRRREVRLEVGPARPAEREPAVRVELACAMPKGARAEWLFEHATEVGVTAFRPLRFARTQASRGGRRARWERIVAAATEQCDRSRLPRVHDEVDLATLLADETTPQERYVAAPAATLQLGPAAGAACILVVGPEGGLTDAEADTLAARRFAPRGLGPLTLRTETAALVGAARLLS